MNLISKKPVSLAEAKELAGKLDEKHPLNEYFRKFVKISKKDSDKYFEALSALNNIKLKADDYVKLIDFMPENAEDVHKVLSHVSISEEEVNSILAVFKK
jgi:DNA-directed RNA polymerase subunit F